MRLDALTASLEPKTSPLEKGDLVKVYIPHDLGAEELKFDIFPGIVMEDAPFAACYVKVFYDNRTYHVHSGQLEKVDEATEV